MSNLVSHYRPELDDGDIRATKPVDDLDWSTLAAMANWANGHGGMLVPWTGPMLTVASGNTRVLPVRVQPKNQAVERIWCINMLASAAGASAAITPNGGSASTFYPSTIRAARRDSYIIRQSLSAKSASAAQASLQVVAAGGDITVESFACYEQTRRILASDTTDYGVDLTTLRPRQPIIDLGNKQIGGVCDAYKNMDARRACEFHWTTATNDSVSPGSTNYTSLFALDPVLQPAIPTYGDTSAALVVAVYAKVDTGTGNVRFTTAQDGDSVAVNVTSTSFAWVTDSVSTECEDLTAADGRRSGWESVTIDAKDPSGGTLSIAAISIYRATTPI